MNFTIIAVGKLKDKFFDDAASEYLKRLKAYGKTEIIEIPAVLLPDNPSDGDICKALEKEALAIKSKIPKGASIYPLCIEGKMLSSEDLAAEINSSAVGGISQCVFIIGGSYGLSDEIKKLAKIKISMSKMTFPHRLARVMLLEQIYRACTITAGTKYHK